MPRKGEEKCQRCGEYGYDRRTLWHACFYQMQELGLPFKVVEIPGTDDGNRRFFTLRCCKDCRALWLQAMKDWFVNGPKEKEPVGSGIFVRRNGATVEISEEEWRQKNPGREPFRVRQS